ncbi:MAG: MAPEG family protein [Bacteriovoracaceae bacterium]
MKIIPLYASLLAFLFVYLSIKTIKLRRKLKISVGDGGNEEMLRAMRVHSNYAEYTPLAILLFSLMELQGAASYFLHALGLAFLIGRCSHAFGMKSINEDFRFRVSGMILTFSSLIISSLYLFINFWLK